MSRLTNRKATFVSLQTGHTTTTVASGPAYAGCFDCCCCPHCAFSLQMWLVGDRMSHCVVNTGSSCKFVQQQCLFFCIQCFLSGYFYIMLQSDVHMYIGVIIPGVHTGCEVSSLHHGCTLNADRNSLVLTLSKMHSHFYPKLIRGFNSLGLPNKLGGKLQSCLR